MSSTTTADSRTRTRIGEKFRDLAKRDARGLVIYLTAGDPNLEATRELLPALERAGADVIELGIPFSDPLADGPVIQRASERALKAGATLPKILAALPGWRRRTEVPLVLFSYYNPILQYGLKEFAADARKAGADGVLAVDLIDHVGDGAKADGGTVEHQSRRPLMLSHRLVQEHQRLEHRRLPGCVHAREQG